MGGQNCIVMREYHNFLFPMARYIIALKVKSLNSYFSFLGITSGMTIAAMTAPTTFVNTDALMCLETDHLKCSNLKYIIKGKKLDFPPPIPGMGFIFLVTNSNLNIK